MSELLPFEELYPHLFQPMTIKKTTFKNRIFAAPQGMNNLVTTESFLNPEACVYYGNKARGGAAVVTTAEAKISPINGCGHNNQINMYDELTLRQFNQFSDYVHTYGALVSIELSHCGQWSLPQYNGGRNPIGPSAKVMPNGNVCDEMTEDDMLEVAQQFADAAIMAKRGGADMALVHGGHSWLLSQFISPVENQRKDKYGGSLENRARFPIMVLDAIRAAMGPDFILEYRLSTNELIEGGMTVEEAVEFVKMIEDKIDIIHCSVGSRRNAVARGVMHPGRFMPHNCNLYAAEAMKRAGIKIPVTTVGAINDPALADRIIAEGKADFVAACRAFIADPDWPEKARAGRADDIRPCIKCLRCTDVGAGRTNSNAKVILQDFKKSTRHIECSVNPMHGRPWMMPHFPRNGVHKKIAVIGGGPAGMQAALEGVRQGYEVVLYEKSDRLGGQLKLADGIDFKQDLANFRDYLIRQVKKSAIDVRLNTAATPEQVKKDLVDAVIVAVGAEPAKPPIPGVDGSNVIFGVDVRANLDRVGRKVVIVGGGMIGCETALELGRDGHQVDLIEMTDMLAADSTFTERITTLHFLEHDYDINTAMYLDETTHIAERVTTRTETRCMEITPEGVRVAGPDGKEELIPADTVVLTAGMKPKAAERDAFRGTAFDVIPVGDCVKPSNLYHATRTGFDAILALSTRNITY